MPVQIPVKSSQRDASGSQTWSQSRHFLGAMTWNLNARSPSPALARLVLTLWHRGQFKAVFMRFPAWSALVLPGSWNPARPRRADHRTALSKASSTIPGVSNSGSTCGGAPGLPG